MGILAVEMEAAGLYGVAAEYEAEALTVVTVSDIIRGGEFKQMSSEEREIGLKTMVEITLNSFFRYISKFSKNVFVTHKFRLGPSSK